MADLDGAIWRKSTRSNNGGECVEVARNLAATRGIVAVRDSKHPSGPVLVFTPDEWHAFLDGAKADEFDL